jgi:hypothetical protein
MKKTITIATLTISLLSCGPSKQELEANQKRQLDSASAAGQQQVLDQQASEQALANEAANQEILKQQLIDLKAQLAAEESKLNDIKQWKLGRTEDEKAQQISDQTRIIEELKNQIIETDKQISR